MRSGLRIDGTVEFQRRLRALNSPTDILNMLQLAAVAEAKALVPRKTGHLGRTIAMAPGSLTRTTVLVQATAPYAAYVEMGTSPHVIKPRHARVLAFPARAAGRRLSGRARSGARMAFARQVKHPGTKAQPYLLPGAIAALKRGGFKVLLIKRWNGAA